MSVELPDVPEVPEPVELPAPIFGVSLELLDVPEPPEPVEPLNPVEPLVSVPLDPPLEPLELPEGGHEDDVLPEGDEAEELLDDGEEAEDDEELPPPEPLTPSALSVCESRVPLADEPCCCWNCCSACFVSEPMMPSTLTLKPFSLSACCTWRTSSLDAELELELDIPELMPDIPEPMLPLDPCDCADCEPDDDVSPDEDVYEPPFAAKALAEASTKVAMMALRSVM